MKLMWFSWLLNGCGNESTGESTVAETAEENETWAPTAQLDAVGAAQHLQDALDGVDVNPADAFSAYLALMAEGDETCPGDSEQMTDSVVYGCESDDGYWYMGVAEYAAADDAEVDGVEYASYRVLSGDFVISTPQDEQMRVGGGTELWVLDDGSAWGLTVGGSWTWEGGSAHWLSQTTSGWFEVEAGPVEAPVWMEVSGGLGIADADVYFGPLVWTGQCPGPTGTAWVRGPEGLWYVLAFADGCSDVAEVTVSDTELGTATVDFSGFTEALMALDVGESR